MRTLKPDFKTIADFRARNATAFKPVFRRFVLMPTSASCFLSNPNALFGLHLFCPRGASF